MATVVLQIVHALFGLSFSLVALRAAGHLRRQPLFAVGWLWTGGTFAVLDLHSLAQSLFAAAAFGAGPGSGLWDRYLAWAPALNHGRTVAITCVFVVLLPLVLRPGRAEYVLLRRRAWVGACAAVAAGGAVGTWMGVVEGSALSPVHFQRVVVMNTLELLVLLTVLFLLLLRDRLDRLLWIALAIYALNVAMHVLLISGMMGFGIAGGWRISPVYTALFNTAFSAVMLALAAVRLGRVRRGGEATGFFRPVRRRVPIF